MDLFVYGTLRSAALMQAVAGGALGSPIGADLPGYAVRPLAGNVVPFVEAAHGAVANGCLWENLSPDQIARLNLYEGAFGYSLQGVTVRVGDASRDVMCYLPPADLVAADHDWSLSDWEADHLAPALAAAAEVFARDPWPNADELRGMWPMIEARAWAKHRAIDRPARHRHQAVPDDFRTVSAEPPLGNFFRFDRVDVRHTRFDGTRSDVLRREGFVGIDAAIVLPYDPVRDRVLLVEQARVGPHLRHDPNPWMLEPVAGIVDAREDPETTAHREAREEAGVTFTELLSAGSFYPSPGASTEYFHTYVGICDLPQEAPYPGGLDAEAEDLRVHPMSLDTALDLADSGELATGPALYLLYWVLRHRGRFRSR